MDMDNAGIIIKEFGITHGGSEGAMVEAKIGEDGPDEVHLVVMMVKWKKEMG